MAKNTQSKKVSREIQAEAMKIAKARQLPGQTKEQTKLIAQGIQKGIEQYRKQESAKARELDKKLKKAKQQTSPPSNPMTQVVEKVSYRQHWLPWLMLALSWGGGGIYFFLSR